MFVEVVVVTRCRARLVWLPPAAVILILTASCELPSLQKKVDPAVELLVAPAFRHCHMIEKLTLLRWPCLQPALL